MSEKKIEDLANEFLKIKSKQAMVEFLYGLFTLKELETFCTRVDIVKMLKKGLPQRDIAEKLRVGVGTVTHGSLELQRGRFKNL
jgi:Trp operon repressor